MDFVFNIWGALLWLLVGGIGGWIISSIFNGPRISELKNSIMDRDSRLMAISRDHKAIIGEQEKKYHSIKSELTQLERSNTDLKTHNSDLRSTIDELRISQDEQLALLFEPIEKSSTINPVSAELQAPTTLSEKIATSDVKTKIPNSLKKLKKTKRQLKKARNRVYELEKQISKLKLAFKKSAKPIIKEIPVIIREEVQIKERIDKKKLEKLFGFKVPTITSKKVVQISKKKGKPVVVK